MKGVGFEGVRDGNQKNNGRDWKHKGNGVIEKYENRKAQLNNFDFNGNTCYPPPIIPQTPPKKINLILKK